MFYFDKAEPLKKDIEHITPDYSIYQKAYSFIKNKKYFTDYSIGYTSRECFRHCEFCVNKNSNKVELHSSINEFVDISRPKIALLDDNILGLSDNNLFKVFDELEETNKAFQYRQGLDIRLLNKERIDRLLKLKYDGNYVFAFDKIEYKNQIEQKLKLFSESMHYKVPGRKFIRTRFYVLCCFDISNKYDLNFWIWDIKNIFDRIEVLFKYKAVPYLMRFEKHKDSPFYGVYMEIKDYCNNTNMICYSQSYNEYIDNGNVSKPNSKKFRDKYPEFRKLFDIKINHAQISF